MSIYSKQEKSLFFIQPKPIVGPKCKLHLLLYIDINNKINFSNKHY